MTVMTTFGTLVTQVLWHAHLPKMSVHDVTALGLARYSYTVHTTIVPGAATQTRVQPTQGA
eukprot:2242699-Amphidinium_carterae.3